MKVICDLEADGLEPTKIHVIICREVENGTVHKFFPTEGKAEFEKFASSVTTWVGHNFMSYDRPAIVSLLGIPIDYRSVLDTLVVSRTVDTLRQSHSLESYGEDFKIKKVGLDITDWTTLTDEMVERCVIDTEINLKLYQKFEKYLFSKRWKDPLDTEHFTSYISKELHKNGFSYSLEESKELKIRIDKELERIDKELKSSFPPRPRLVREVYPRMTKHGTIAKNSIPKVLGNDLSFYSPNAPFSLLEYQEFNPGSPKQIVERLNEAGWSPTEKTKGHRDAEKLLRELKWRKRGRPTPKAEIAALEARLQEYSTYGWSVSEDNLKTLPDTAPEAAKSLARRLLLASRSSTLTTWMEAYSNDTGRIHGSFNHIGAWTHRMSHDKPNMGNIPRGDGSPLDTNTYASEMRALWRSAPGRLLVGVDAESIQLRVFGHHVNDPAFTFALTKGKKEDGTDPHSLNQKALGTVCRSRNDAKTFIYAWLLGAGTAMVAKILNCSHGEAQRAVDNFIDFYPGLRVLREGQLVEDAGRGYFCGLDGRYIRIYGDDSGTRRHFALAGYLQSGEAIIMKRAMQIWYPKLQEEGVDFKIVNFVHDEWQTEVSGDMETALHVAETQADAIRVVGEQLNLNCPMAGSVLNAHGKLAIGDTWLETH